MTATIAAERESAVTIPVLAAPPRTTHDRLPWLVLGLCIASFAYGLSTIRSAAVSEYGLLATASPAYAMSILLAGFGFAVAVQRNNIRAAAAATITMIVVQRLPASAATDAPMYGWTYKHLGVVDYIQHEHSLARGVDIYNGWPGLFVVTAWFSDLTGIPPLAIAHWFTFCFHLAFALMVYAAARAWGLESLTALTATFIVASLNWVAQDYYSPQAMAMLLTAALFVIVGLSRTKPGGPLLIILLFAAETITHQLTPYWVLATLGVLVVSRRLKPWWILIPLAAILLGFLFYNFGEVARSSPLFSFNIFSNARSSISTVGSVGQQVTSMHVRILSCALWGATLCTLVFRWRTKQPFWALGVLALSPFVILFGQSYGNEAIYRVFLYSLLGCSLVIAPVLVDTLQCELATFLLGVVALLVVVGLSAQGYLGSWFVNLVSKNDLEISKTLLAQADSPSYLMAVGPVWPERSTWRYVEYARFSDRFDNLLIYDGDLTGSHFNTEADYRKLDSVLAKHSDASTYLLMSDEMRLYAWYFGLLPLDAIPNLKAHLAQDPSWSVVRDSEGMTVYKHREAVN